MNDDQREKLFFQDEKHEKVNICMNIFIVQHSLKLLVISLQEMELEKFSRLL